MRRFPFQHPFCLYALGKNLIQEDWTALFMAPVFLLCVQLAPQSLDMCFYMIYIQIFVSALRISSPKLQGISLGQSWGHGAQLVLLHLYSHQLFLPFMLQTKNHYQLLLSKHAHMYQRIFVICQYIGNITADKCTFMKQRRIPQTQQPANLTRIELELFGTIKKKMTFNCTVILFQ